MDQATALAKAGADAQKSTAVPGPDPKVVAESQQAAGAFASYLTDFMTGKPDYPAVHAKIISVKNACVNAGMASQEMFP